MKTFPAVLVTLFALASCECAHTKEVARAVAKDFYDCTTAAAAARVGELAPIVMPAVVQAFAGEKPDLAPLKALGKAGAADVLGCAIASAHAALAKARELGPKTHAQDVDPVAVRGAFRALSAELYAGARFKTPDGEL